MPFTTRNQLAAKSKWSAQRIVKFQKILREFQRISQVETQDLARMLDYSPKYLKLLRGDYKSITRQPSEEFLRRFAELRASAPQPKRVYVLGRRATISVDKTLVEFLASTCARLVKANARMRKRR